MLANENLSATFWICLYGWKCKQENDIVYMECRYCQRRCCMTQAGEEFNPSSNHRWWCPLVYGEQPGWKILLQEWKHGKTAQHNTKSTESMSATDMLARTISIERSMNESVSPYLLKKKKQQQQYLNSVAQEEHDAQKALQQEQQQVPAVEKATEQPIHQPESPAISAEPAPEVQQSEILIVQPPLQETPVAVRTSSTTRAGDYVFNFQGSLDSDDDIMKDASVPPPLMTPPPAIVIPAPHVKLLSTPTSFNQQATIQQLERFPSPFATPSPSKQPVFSFYTPDQSIASSSANNSSPLIPTSHTVTPPQQQDLAAPPSEEVAAPDDEDDAEDEEDDTNENEDAATAPSTSNQQPPAVSSTPAAKSKIVHLTPSTPTTPLTTATFAAPKAAKKKKRIANIATATTTTKKPKAAAKKRKPTQQGGKPKKKAKK